MFYIILVFGVFVDLFTKYLANIYLQDRINILGEFLYFQFIRNPGIAFGIEIYPLLLKIITISLIILIFYYYKGEKKNISKMNSPLIRVQSLAGRRDSGKAEGFLLLDISFGLILAGAIGNGIERILNSNVIDFIGVKYFSIFNLADSFITIGAIIYIYILYKNNK